jgi:hypothetical protein
MYKNQLYGVIPPRLVFTKTQLDFIREKAFSSKISFVSGVNAQVTIMKSDSLQRVSKSTNSASFTKKVNLKYCLNSNFNEIVCNQFKSQRTISVLTIILLASSAVQESRYSECLQSVHNSQSYSAKTVNPYGGIGQSLSTQVQRAPRAISPATTGLSS